MSIISAIIGPILNAIYQILKIYKYVVLISVLLTWFRPDPYNPIVRFLYSITQPVFNRVRKWLPFLRLGMIDLSPIAVFILIEIILGIIRVIMVNIMVP